MLSPVTSILLVFTYARFATPSPAQAQPPSNSNPTLDNIVMTPRLNESRDPIVTCLPHIPTSIFDANICRQVLDSTIFRFPSYSQDQPFVAESRPQIYPDNPRSVPPFGLQGEDRGEIKCAIIITTTQPPRPDVFSWRRVTRVVNKILHQCTGSQTTNSGGYGAVGNRDRWYVAVKPFMNPVLNVVNGSSFFTTLVPLDDATAATTVAR